MVSKREKVIHNTLAVIFTAVGLLVSFDLIHLTSQVSSQHAQLEDQIKCNTRLIAVLRTRSDARLVVDNATRGAQDSLVALLEDMQEHGANTIGPQDPHVVHAAEAFEEAARSRTQRSLWEPYPEC